MLQRLFKLKKRAIFVLPYDAWPFPLPLFVFGGVFFSLVLRCLGIFVVFFWWFTWLVAFLWFLRTFLWVAGLPGSGWLVRVVLGSDG